MGNQEDIVQAVEKMCLQCAADGQVEGCTEEECPIYDLGVKKLMPRVRSRPVILVLAEKIRDRCMECCGYQARDVLLCEGDTCPLWPWRDGTGIPMSPGENEAFGKAVLAGQFQVKDESDQEVPTNSGVESMLFGSGVCGNKRKGGIK